jgi:outer membrane protein insertion porin family
MGKIFSNFNYGTSMKTLFTLFLLFYTSLSFAETVKSIHFDGMVHISEPVALRMLSFESGEDVPQNRLMMR